MSTIGKKYSAKQRDGQIDRAYATGEVDEAAKKAPIYSPPG